VTAPQRPDVDPYDGPPPIDLVVEDISVGDGPEAVSGQTVSVHYVGVAHSTGEEFDASWNRGAPFQFPLGSGRVIEDIAVGDGPEAVPGQTVTVHYVGVAHSTGEEFDASWNRGAPFRFPLGAGRVIGGWDKGVAGMKVGGRRKLVIPPHLGYGDRGAGGVIKPGETLVFVVDLLGAR